MDCICIQFYVCSIFQAQLNFWNHFFFDLSFLFDALQSFCMFFIIENILKCLDIRLAPIDISSTQMVFYEIEMINIHTDINKRQMNKQTHTDTHTQHHCLLHTIFNQSFSFSFFFLLHSTTLFIFFFIFKLFTSHQFHKLIA